MMATLGRWDIAVVGGGVFGLACARACAREGRKTALLEMRTVGSGASGGPVGAMAPFSPAPWTRTKQFQFDGLISAGAYWSEVERETGLSPGYGRIGRIVPLATQDACDRARLSVTAAEHRWGDLASMWIEPRSETWVYPDRAKFGVVRDSLAARIRPQAACAALRQAVSNRQVDVIENCRVMRVESGRLCTERGDVIAEAIVVAAGADTFRLIEGIAPGISGGGVKGQAAFLECSLPDMPVVQSGRIYVVPHANGTVGVGSTRETEWNDRSRTDARLDAVIDEARSLVPSLGSARLLGNWAGLRPRADGSNPLVGPVPGHDELFVATGGHGIGFSIVHMVADAIAAMVRGRVSQFPPEFMP